MAFVRLLGTPPSSGATCPRTADGYSLPERDSSSSSTSESFARVPPRVLLLEWLVPPFDGGHWVPGQLLAAGTTPASNVDGGKSRALSWDEVEAADPDVLVVACCGFDLARNRRDTEQLLGADTAVGARFRALRAVRTGRLYALDGNSYFARPAPSLSEGAAILACCAQDGDAAVCRRLDALGFLPPEGQAWLRVGAQAVADKAARIQQPAFLNRERALGEGPHTCRTWCSMASPASPWSGT